MTYGTYVVMTVLRLAILPFWLVRCVYVYMMAVYKEKGVRVYVDESRDFSGTDDNGSGSAGVTDTAATIRAKTGQFGKAKRAGEFGSPN